MATTRQRREMVMVLQRRRNFLTNRITQMEERGAPAEQAHHDKAERQALRWALQIILAADEQDILGDLEAVAVEGARS